MTICNSRGAKPPSNLRYSFRNRWGVSKSIKKFYIFWDIFIYFVDVVVVVVVVIVVVVVVVSKNTYNFLSSRVEKVQGVM